MKVLITCPPMIKQVLLGRYDKEFRKYNMTYYCPEFEQSMDEDKLSKIVGLYDSWIIGDDKVTRKILENGKKGNLKSCVRWGVGCDNIDFNMFEEFGIPICNTPNVFGEEVADLCVGYVVGLSRDSFFTDRKVREGKWNMGKVCGISMKGKKICLIGFGDIGKNICKRLGLGFDMKLYVSDPFYSYSTGKGNTETKEVERKIVDLKGNIIKGYDYIKLDSLDNCLKDADFIIVSCSLNKHTFHLLGREKILYAKRGVRIVNISRGSVINEPELLELLNEGFISRVALDVFETEPIDINNQLLEYDRCIVGCHNGSNTIEAVDKVSIKCLGLLNDFSKL